MIDTPKMNPPSQEECNMALLCVLLQILALFSVIGGLIGPMILWVARRDGSKFIDEVGKETINFQITLLILGMICFALVPVFGLGVLLLFLLGIYALIVIILAARSASEGRVFRYSICLRLLK